MFCYYYIFFSWNNKKYLYSSCLLYHNTFLNFQLVTACRRVEDYLNRLLEKMAANMGLESMDRLTEDFHVYPDFHGNRSPVADPTLKGMV